MECDYSKSHFSMEFEAARSAPSYRYDSVSDRIVSIGAFVERISEVESDFTANSEDPFIVIFDAMKSKVPKFDGADPEGWISQIDRLFNSYNAPEEWRMRLVSYHMEGKADDWFLWSLANNQLLTWTEFRFRLQQHFGSLVYESRFTESMDTITAQAENMKSGEENIQLEEAISTTEFVQEEIGAETKNLEPTTTKVKELPGNLEKKGLHSFSSLEFADCKDPKPEVKFEAKNGSCRLPLAHVMVSIPVVSLGWKVFDEMTERTFNPFTKVDEGVRFGELICRFMEGKELKHDTDLIFDPGGGNFYDSILSGDSLYELPPFCYTIYDLTFLLTFWRFHWDINVRTNIAYGCFENFGTPAIHSQRETNVKRKREYTVVGVFNERFYVTILEDPKSALGGRRFCGERKSGAEKLSTHYDVPYKNVKEVTVFHPNDSLLVVYSQGDWVIKGMIQVYGLIGNVCYIMNSIYKKSGVSWFTLVELLKSGYADEIVDIIHFLDFTVFLMIGFTKKAHVENYDVVQCFLVCYSLRACSDFGMDRLLISNIKPLENAYNSPVPKLQMANNEWLLEIILKLHVVATGNETKDAIGIGGMEVAKENVSTSVAVAKWRSCEFDGGVQVVAILACCRSMELFELSPTLKTRWFSLGNGMIHQLG